MKKETKITIAVFLAVAFLFGTLVGITLKEMSLDEEATKLTRTHNLSVYEDDEIKDEYHKRTLCNGDVGCWINAKEHIDEYISCELYKFNDEEIQDEFEERFGSVLKKEDWKDIEELTEIPFELWETMTRRGIFWQTWNMGHNVGFKEGSELVEEPQVCIHERYKQIKDTMKSKAGTEFEWHEYYCSEPFRKYLQDTEPNGELFISEDTGRLCFPQGAVYTKEEILTNFFEPI